MASGSTPTSPTSSMPSATSNLSPTWHGYVSDTREALILFEATLQGHLHRVTRRPHDRERANLIRSGSVFIYEEGASGIKRWTDGVSWSPSRILNNFLIYRELEKPFPPGEKKRAKPKQKPASGGDDAKSDGLSDGGLKSPTTPQSATSTSFKQESSADRDAVRSLVGSLTDSYAFKEGGLVKKTMSVVVGGSHFHLVSYYNPEDVRNGHLPKPMETELRYTKVRGELVTRQNFRAPIDDAEEVVPASQYGVPTPRPYALQQAFMSPEYMQQALAQQYSPHSPYGMPMQQQHPQDPYADHRHGMQMHSPTQQSSYMPQLPQMQMRPDFAGYQQYQDQRSYQQPQQQPQQRSQQQQHQQGQQSPQSPDYPGHMQMPGSAGLHGWPGNPMGQR